MLTVFSVTIISLISNQQAIAQSPHVGDNYLPGTLVNFIRTWDATAPEQDANTLMTRPLKDVKQATQYIDGLGRPLQTVIKMGSLVTDPSNPLSSANATDMVSPVEYDVFGREQYKWLPYKSTASDGAFKLYPFTDQPAFYSSNNTASPVYNQGENYFYSKTNFEASPINRVTDNYAPGVSWAGSEGNAAAQQRNVQIKYAINTTTDAVRIWKVTDNATLGEFGTYTSTPTTNYTAVYDAGTLYKTITTDEHKKQVIEFKDKEGKVILKKVQLTATADDGTGSGYADWLCTYYIYDDFNNLRCVIQPEGVKAILSTWALTTTLLDEQCFRYEYDQRKRMIKKKVPAAAAVSMVYDLLDRLILTQDGNLAAQGQGKWMYTQYDELNRPIATGLWPSALTWAQHAANAAGNISYPSLSGNEELTRTFYNDYTWLNNYSNPLPASYNSSYDSYFQTASNTAWPYPQANTQSANVKGMPTGSRIKVLGTTNTYLYTVIFYDGKDRVIQTQGTNITGGTDIATIQYTWAGQPLVTIQKQEKVGGTNAQTTIVVSQMTYDDLGRLSKTEKKVSNTLVNSNTMPAYKTIVQNEYNALGQLKTKKLAPQYNNNAGLETLNYDYNIRGWTLGMNRDYTKDATSTNYFGFDLGYDKTNNGLINNQTYAAPQYNGNIEGTVWKSRGDGEKRKYDFTYDAANRILSADFNQYSGSVFDKSAQVDFSLSNMSYDGNGNIITMNQAGLKINSSSLIDQLTYTYLPNSNKLQQVTDAVNGLGDSKLGDFKYNPATKTATDYSYDVNGNLNLDNNKAITSITYNHLNLPQVITVQAPSTWINGSRTITFTYDAAGNKLQKLVSESMGPNANRAITTTYIDGFVYDTKITNQGGVPEADDHTDVLQFIPQEEGRIRFKPASLNSNGTVTVPASFQYDYMLKDHLGNVRMVLTEEQQQDHYPTATLEANALTQEQAYYDINSSYVVGSPSNVPGYINDNNTNNQNTFGNSGALSQKMYQLNANTNKTGLSMVLKVMAGDNLNILAKSWYEIQGGAVTNSTLGATEILTGFLSSGGAGNQATIHGATLQTLSNNVTGTINPINLFSNNNTVNASNNVKAGLCYIIFDEQFKYVSGGFDPVFWGPNNTSGGLKDHFFQNIAIPKNGYIYIYCSNESNINVFFDNLEVIHTRGQILEETHYYPFGLTMIGISSKSAGSLENKTKYNGIEFDNDLDLNNYEAFFRDLDPQIGRWWGIDPKTESMEEWSPYVPMFANPISNKDPLGDVAFDDYKIKKNGSIEVLRTEDAFDRFYVETSEPTKVNLTASDANGVTTSYNLVATLDKNEAGLVLFPSSGNGFSRYGSSESGGISSGTKKGKSFTEVVGTGDHYVKPITAAALFGLIADLNDHGIKNISFGDMSSSNGSDPALGGKNTFHHAGHGHMTKRSGLDIDFRYIDNKGRSFQGVMTDKRYSQAYNQIIYNSAERFGFTKNYQGTSGNLNGPAQVAGHNNHGHLGLTPSNVSLTEYSIIR